jgi:hypothetical protein
VATATRDGDGDKASASASRRHNRIFHESVKWRGNTRVPLYVPPKHDIAARERMGHIYAEPRTSVVRAGTAPGVARARARSRSTGDNGDGGGGERAGTAMPANARATATAAAAAKSTSGVPSLRGALRGWQAPTFDVSNDFSNLFANGSMVATAADEAGTYRSLASASGHRMHTFVCVPSRRGSNDSAFSVDADDTGTGSGKRTATSTRGRPLVSRTKRERAKRRDAAAANDVAMNAKYHGRVPAFIGRRLATVAVATAAKLDSKKTIK